MENDHCRDTAGDGHHEVRGKAVMEEVLEFDQVTVSPERIRVGVDA